MHGIKGFSRYVLVERDLWLASPIRRDARVREDKYAMFRRVNEVAERYRFAETCGGSPVCSCSGTGGMTGSKRRAC